MPSPQQDKPQLSVPWSSLADGVDLLPTSRYRVSSFASTSEGLGVFSSAESF